MISIVTYTFLKPPGKVNIQAMTFFSETEQISDSRTKSLNPFSCANCLRQWFSKCGLQIRKGPPGIVRGLVGFLLFYYTAEGKKYCITDFLCFTKFLS
jgi:hypothetical protein